MSFFKRKNFIIFLVVILALDAVFAIILVLDQYFINITSFAQILPQDIVWYASINIDSQSSQVQQLFKVLYKFPLADKIEKALNNAWDQSIKEDLEDTPIIKFPAFFEGSKEITVVQTDLDDFDMLLIADQLDKKRKKNIIDSLITDKSLETKIERYKDKDIYLAKDFNIAILDSFMVWATKAEDIKKIIDIYKDQELLSLNLFNKTKSLFSNKNYQKISQNYNSQYLAAGYAANADINQKVSQVSSAFINKVNLKAALLTPSTAISPAISLAKDLMSYEVLWIDEDDLKFNSYVLDLKKDKKQMASFDISQSLANLMPQQINNRWIDFYEEGKDLNQAVEVLIQVWERIKQEMPKDDYGQAIVSAVDKLPQLLNSYFNIDLTEDLLPYATNNFAFFAAPSFDNLPPEIGMVIQLNNAETVKENLKKIKTDPNAINLLSISFEVKDDKLIISSSPDGVKSIIEGMADSSRQKLAQNPDFQYQFKNLPASIQGFSYGYTLGIWGIIKYFFNEASVLEDLAVPYLKTVKTFGFYSFLKDDIQQSYQTIHIEEVSQAEKEKAEEIFNNFFTKFNEN